jgi:ketosteroid isomerase-like protein
MCREPQSDLNKALIARYWSAASARDWQAFGELLHPEVVYEVPQTRERVRGREDYVEFNASYPGDWGVEVKSLITSETQGVSRIDFSIAGEVQTGVSFFELQDGMIRKITDFWPEEYEPPQRYCRNIEHF